MNLEEFESNIGYKFKDSSLLKKALTHTSYAYENKIESNEKLEYLGDSILEFVVSKYLYNNHSKLSEGEMTKVRANVVCEDSLFEIAKRHGFSDFLYLGKSEKASKNSKKAILADSVEAIIAAIYLDSNVEQAEKFIIENLSDYIDESTKHVGDKDYKTVLQERLQIHGEVVIKYNVIKELGPDHEKIFVVEVLCNNKKLAEGMGRNKKQAEMDAAKNALNNM